MINKILVYVEEDLLGDGILKLPFVFSLHARFPKAHITWMAGYGRSSYSQTLKSLVEGTIDRVLEGFYNRPKKVWMQDPVLQEKFDLIIDTERSLKITWRLKRIPHRYFLSYTWRQIFSSHRFKAKRKKVPLSVNLTNLLLALPFPPTPSRQTPFCVPLAPSYIDFWRSYFDPETFYIGIAPGAGNMKKCWPLSHFQCLAQKLEKKSKRCVFILGPQELPFFEVLRRDHPTALFPLQEMQVPEASPLYTIGLGHFLKAAVANDSGTGHLLGASPVPLISLFGPTSPHKLRPFTQNLTIIQAQTFGGDEMHLIPPEAVENVLDKV